MYPVSHSAEKRSSFPPQRNPLHSRTAQPNPNEFTEQQLQEQQAAYQAADMRRTEELRFVQEYLSLFLPHIPLRDFQYWIDQGYEPFQAVLELQTFSQTTYTYERLGKLFRLLSEDSLPWNVLDIEVNNSPENDEWDNESPDYPSNWKRRKQRSFGPGQHRHR